MLLFFVSIVFNQITHAADKSLKLTSQEQAFLNSIDEIRICADPDWLPYEGIDNQGNFTGIMAEFHALWSKRMDKPIVLVPTQSWSESLQFMQEKKCDVLSSAQYLPERDDYLLVSNTVIQYPLALVTHSDAVPVEDLTAFSVPAEPVTMLKGHAGIKLVMEDYPDIHLNIITSAANTLQDIEKGQLAGFIDTIPSIYYQMTESGISNLKINKILDVHYDTAVGIRNDWPLLLSIYNKNIAETSASDRQEILNHWLSLRYDYPISWTKLTEYAIALLVLLVFLVYRYRLLHQHNIELRKLNEKLTDLSQKDQLTNLANRRYLDEVFSKEIPKILLAEQPFSLILLDIDFFKNVNDNYGHAVGDQVIIKVATILTTHIREADKVARWGGEEFLIFCPNTKLDGAEKLANCLRSLIEQSHFEAMANGVTASFGVAVSEPGDVSIEQVLVRADEALYDAKSAGRNIVITRET